MNSEHWFKRRRFSKISIRNTIIMIQIGVTSLVRVTFNVQRKNSINKSFERFWAEKKSSNISEHWYFLSYNIIHRKYYILYFFFIFANFQNLWMLYMRFPVFVPLWGPSLSYHHQFCKSEYHSPKVHSCQLSSNLVWRFRRRSRKC